MKLSSVLTILAASVSLASATRDGHPSSLSRAAALPPAAAAAAAPGSAISHQASMPSIHEQYEMLSRALKGKLPMGFTEANRKLNGFFYFLSVWVSLEMCPLSFTGCFYVFWLFFFHFGLVKQVMDTVQRKAAVMNELKGKVLLGGGGEIMEFPNLIRLTHKQVSTKVKVCLL